MRRPCIAALGIAILMTASRLEAQTATAVEALWQVNIHVEKLFASPLGPTLNDIIYAKAPDGKVHVDAFVEAMGMDPRTAVREVVIFGDGFEPTNVRVVANIGSTRGNIEGWLLAAPGYKSETIDDATLLHSFLVERGPGARLWCAIPWSKSTNSHTLIAGFDRETTLALARQAAEQGIAEFGGKLTGDTILSVTINDLARAPIEIDENDPGSGLIKTLQSVSVTASNANDQQLVVTTDLTADSPARAQQLQQFLTGMKAMVQLAIPEKNPEAKNLTKLLNHVNVEYTEGSKSLATHFAMDFAQIQEILKSKHRGHHAPASGFEDR